ncbi:MAG: lytic transglycosylase domain-containing protein [Methylophilaceae bacterium]
MLKSFILFAYCMLAALPSLALADIYQLPPESAEVEEIVLSNFEAEGAEILIAEAIPQQGIAIAPVSNSATQVLPFAAEVQVAAQQSALEPALIHAVMATESHLNPKAISPKGAQGLMQLMPATAKRFGVKNPYDPLQNLVAGANYLRELKDKFNGNLHLALAAYNAGPGAVVRYGSKIPPFAETQRYVPAVMHLYRKLSEEQL